MQYKDFSDEAWSLITQKIDEAVKLPGPHYAAFDADGTLWDNDAGNAFFDHEIDHKLVPLPPEPWKYVYAIKDQDPRKAFLWLAQIHNGLPLKTVRQWAQESFDKNNGINCFPAIKKLVKYLQSKKVQIFVVTASVKWAVEPCVAQLGIPFDNVLGVQTKVENGIITDVQDGPVTYREGKSEALLLKTNNKRPILSCGNTMGDYWLLDISTHVQLAVRTESHEALFKDRDILNQEMKLYHEAVQRKWITHSFL
jgi:HAD superfamily phosphoserine phosphatase-like hydrolase